MRLVSVHSRVEELREIAYDTFNDRTNFSRGRSNGSLRQNVALQDIGPRHRDAGFTRQHDMVIHVTLRGSLLFCLLGVKLLKKLFREV